MWRRTSHHLSEQDQPRNGLRRWVALTGAVIAAVAGMTALAASASAHDAPPKGTASCQTYGPSYTWQVTDGSTFVENAAGSDWSVSFATSAGTVSAAGATTGSNNTSTGPSFTVTDIPATAASITVTSTLKWGTAPNYTAGTDNHTTTIARPATGCNIQVDVPGAPDVTAPTCSAVGTLVIPSDTASVTWTVTPAYTAGDTGQFTVTATAASGSVFKDGKTVEDYPVTVPGKVTGAACDTVVTPVAPSVTQSVCDGPGTNTSPTLTIPSTTGVIYKINGSVVSGVLPETVGVPVTVVATPAAGYKFAGADQSISTLVSFASAGDCSVSATPAKPDVSEIACNGPGSDAHSTLSIPTTTGVIYTINGVAVSGSIDETGASAVTVKAIPAPGYFFDQDATTSWTFTFTPVDCSGLARVVAPGFVATECTTGPLSASNGRYTIPSSPHVIYEANGKVVSAGTHKAAPGSTVTVTATADKGYLLDSSKSSWTHTFEANFACRGTDAAHVHRTPVTPTPTALASTGVPTGSLLLGGLVIVALGVGLLLAGGVRGRKNRA